MKNKQVKLRALTGSEAIRDAETMSDFPVLVQVTAPPWRRAEEMPRAGVDIVAVLDYVWCTVSEIEIFINKLSSNDRLSLVLTGTNLHRLMELTFMSAQGRTLARSKIKEFCTKEVSNIAAGLREGAEVYNLQPK
jgi:hypothetical protein